MSEDATPTPSWQAGSAHTIAHPNARTRANQGAFLAAFMRIPSVTRASIAAGIGRRTHYDWLETDPEYRKMFEEAKPIAYDALEDLAVEAAVEGLEETTIENGIVTKVVKKRSERLLELLLRAKKPKEYKNTIAHTGADGESPVEIELSARDELLSRIAGLASRVAAPTSDREP